jgi:hypothetical protein
MALKESIDVRRRREIAATAVEPLSLDKPI